MKQNLLIMTTPQDGEVLGRAFAIGERSPEELAGVIPDTSIRDLIDDEVVAVIHGLRRASAEFHFAGHDRRGNEIARKLGIQTTVAHGYLAQIALSIFDPTDLTQISTRG